MQLKVTADSSVLLALGKLGYPKLVNELFDKVFVAQSVFEEISGGFWIDTELCLKILKTKQN